MAGEFSDCLFFHLERVKQMERLGGCTIDSRQVRI